MRLRIPDEAAGAVTSRTEGTYGVASHLRAPGHGRADRRHHRPVRVPESRALRTACAGAEHLAVRAAIGRVLGRAYLPFPGATAHRKRPGESGSVRRGRRGSLDRNSVV